MLGFNTTTERRLACFVIVVFSIGAVWGVSSLGPLVWYRVYGAHIHPFEDHNLAVSNGPSTPTSWLSNFRNNIGLAPTAAQIKPVASDQDQPEGTSLAVAPSPAEGAGAPKNAVAQAGASKSNDEPATDAKSSDIQATAVETPVPSPAPANKLPETQAEEKKPFKPEDYELTREMAHRLAHNGRLLVTWTNNHYFDFARSWSYHVKKSGLGSYLVGAMDDEVLGQLAAADIHTFRMNTGMTTGDFGWGSPNFHKMGRFKINLIKTFLDLDITVVISDIDVMWVQDPLPYFERYPEAGLLTSTDQLGPTVTDDSLERWPDAGSAFNIGIMMFKPTEDVKKLVDEWIKALDKPDYWDQNAFNDLVRRGASPSGDKNLFKGYDGTVTVGILPASLFASGHSFFVQRLYEKHGLKPYCAHATFQYSGTPGKRHRFREALLWDDPPEYFNHPQGFVTFTIDIPKELVDAAKPPAGWLTVEGMKPHFDLVHHQLARIRNAMAYASITGRAIIMPPLLCALDKYWAPLLDGRLPGSHLQLPFICPMDHVFNLEGGWAARLSEDHFGPPIYFREYSFLANHRLPQEVNNSRVRLEFCDPGTEGCNHGEGPAETKDGVIKLSRNLKKGQLLTALAPASSVRILDLGVVPLGAFGGFEDEKDDTRWRERLNIYTASTCCAQQTPGWVFYDMFWDMPHTDRFRRSYGEEWRLIPGDHRRSSRKLAGAELQPVLDGERGAAQGSFP